MIEHGKQDLTADASSVARPAAPPATAGAALAAGAKFLERNDPEAAVAAWRWAIEIDRRCVPAYLNIAKVLEDRGEVEQAAYEYRRALDVAPGTLPALRGLVHTCVRRGQLAEAFEACQKILEVEKSDGWAIATQAWLRERQGKVQEAYALIAPAVREQPADVNIATAFAKICERLQPPSAEAVPVLEALTQRAGLADEDRRQLFRALAQLYDALGRFDEAFANLQETKKLEPDPALRKRVARARAVAAEAVAAYTHDRLARLPRATHGCELPIFVVGMPRSGTTLAEQILSSHPRVHGAGELPYIPRIAINVLPQAQTYPACLDQLTLEKVNWLAQLYLRRLRTSAPGALRVVDKMMFNYEHLGLIQLLFPQARVVHCVRHPLDTCLSIYFRDIAGLPENRDLASLGRRYRGYRELMARWQETLALRIFTLRYEALVAEPERTVRELLAFCGLDWDDGCLRFHESRRHVQTYSYHQVRQPLYRGSVGRYKAYERHLGPLKTVLGDILGAAA